MLEVKLCSSCDGELRLVTECLITDEGISQFVNMPVNIDNMQAGIIEGVEHDENGVRAIIKLNEIGSEKLKKMLLRDVKHD